MSSLFFSYSHKDEALRDRLEVHLAGLKREGAISAWHDRRIMAGDPLGQRIDEHLESADIILLLVSPDFLASDYCHDVEMQRALERQEDGTARVIPVILRPCDWQHSPFAHLLAAPTDGKPGLLLVVWSRFSRSSDICCNWLWRGRWVRRLGQVTGYQGEACWIRWKLRVCCMSLVSARSRPRPTRLASIIQRWVVNSSI